MALANELRIFAFLTLFLGAVVAMAVQVFVTWYGRPKDNSERLPWLQIAYGICFLAIVVNFPLFLAHVYFAGGDAINGRFESGRYLLGNRGKMTEVSQFRWYLNLLHCWLTGLSFVCTILLASLRDLLLICLDRFFGR